MIFLSPAFSRVSYVWPDLSVFAMVNTRPLFFSSSRVDMVASETAARWTNGRPRPKRWMRRALAGSKRVDPEKENENNQFIHMSHVLKTWVDEGS